MPDIVAHMYTVLSLTSAFELLTAFVLVFNTTNASQNKCTFFLPWIVKLSNEIENLID